VASSGSSSAGSSADPYAQAWERVEDAILESPGALPVHVRRAIAQGEDPPELAVLLEKVRHHAYRIVDADLEGVEVDVMLEAVLAASLAAGEERRRAALKALE
jgi:hypothetical protein